MNIRFLFLYFRFLKRLTIALGYINLIRFIWSNQILNVFGEKFTMTKDTEYKYIWTTINTAYESLSVYSDSRTIIKYPYSLPENSNDLSKTTF